MAVIFSVFKYLKEIKIKATTENSHINLQLAFTSIQNATKYRKLSVYGTIATNTTVRE